MPTRIYGASDDLIEFEGDVRGEVGYYGPADCLDAGALVICSDGTLLRVSYGKGRRGIWCVSLERKGTLFVSIEPCDDEDASIHSDVAVFADGLKWAYAATRWENVE